MTHRVNRSVLNHTHFPFTDEENEDLEDYLDEEEGEEQFDDDEEEEEEEEEEEVEKGKKGEEREKREPLKKGEEKDQDGEKDDSDDEYFPPSHGHVRKRQKIINLKVDVDQLRKSQSIIGDRRHSSSRDRSDALSNFITEGGGSLFDVPSSQRTMIK